MLSKFSNCLDKHRKNEHGMWMNSPAVEKRVKTDAIDNPPVDSRVRVEEDKTYIESSTVHDEVVVGGSCVKEGEEIKTELDSSADEMPPAMYSCDKCETTFTRKDGLNRHRRLSRCNTLKVQNKRLKIIDDLLMRYSRSNGDPFVGRKDRVPFISEKRFDQLAPLVQRSVEWADLSRGCIYKLISLHGQNDQIVADLTGRDNTVLIVPLPEFVIGKLLAAAEEPASCTVYLRPTGADQVIMVVVKKHV